MMRNWWHISSLFKPRVGRQMGPLKDECGQRPRAVRHALLAPRPTNALLTKKGWTRSSNVSCISTIVLNNIWLRLWMRWWNASCICTIVLNSTFCSDFERVDEMYHGSLPILLNTMFLRISPLSTSFGCRLSHARTSRYTVDMILQNRQPVYRYRSTAADGWVVVIEVECSSLFPYTSAFYFPFSRNTRTKTNHFRTPFSD